METDPGKQPSIRALEATNFFVADAQVATDEIRVAFGPRPQRKSAERDQDNALKAWPQHGLLGTQLGPNKDGKKW